MSTDTLVIFARDPIPGKTKTRLIPALGADGAAELHMRMTKTILSHAKNLADGHAVEILTFRYGDNEKKMQESFSFPGPLLNQPEGHLGEKIAFAFQTAFESGCERCIIIGSDCPGLTADPLHRAFTKLHQKEAVIYPAEDGGYVLIGLTRESFSKASLLFEKMDWGESTVLEETLIRAENSGLDLFIGPTFRDIDRPEDLAPDGIHNNKPAHSAGKVVSNCLLPDCSSDQH